MLPMETAQCPGLRPWLWTITTKEAGQCIEKWRYWRSPEDYRDE